MSPSVNPAGGPRVFVGLSGGVDSAVSAALLLRAGARITGVFIKGSYPSNLSCTWASDRQDAMRVAAMLRIPFTTLDASDIYKRSVLDYLIAEYAAGRTPNPDVMCNRDVKFGAFYKYAKQEGANLIATGHYARAGRGAPPRLFRGRDATKDQSYFLWAVSPNALAMSFFPLGTLTKDTVRTLAREFRLPVADKKDSQGICFLGPVSVEDFLRDEFGEAPGRALDEEGRELGRHDGVLLHTLGERIALRNAPPGPWYVIRKDVPDNVLVVSKERKELHPSRRLTISHANWFSGSLPQGPVTVEYRYHGPCIAGSLSEDGLTFIPREALPEPVASGQSLVIYRDDECLGGGIIE